MFPKSDTLSHRFALKAVISAFADLREDGNDIHYRHEFPPGD